MLFVGSKGGIVLVYGQGGKNGKLFRLQRWVRVAEEGQRVLSLCVHIGASPAFVAACQGGGLTKWRADTGTKIGRFSGHTADVYCVRVSAMSGTSSTPYLFSASQDCSVKRWDLSSGRVEASYVAPTKLDHVEVEPAIGAVFASSISSHVIVQFDAKSCEVVRLFRADDFITWTCSTPTHLFSSHNNATVKAWLIDHNAKTVLQCFEADIHPCCSPTLNVRYPSPRRYLPARICRP